MQTIKEKFINEILVEMSPFLSTQQTDFLKKSLGKKLASIDFVQTETLPATRDNTNDYLLNLFKTQKQNKLSEKTIGYYIGSLQRLIDFCNKPITAMDSIDIAAFLDSLRSTNSNTSINNHRRNISAFFSWLRKSHFIIENPVEATDPYVCVKKPIDHLDPLEKERLRDCCDTPKEKAIFEFLRQTAARIGEVTAVRINDIDFTTGAVNIYASKTRSYRTVGLDSVAINYINDYLNERHVEPTSNAPLFTTKKGNTPLSTAGFRYCLKKLRNKSGLSRRVYPHLFRKTTATDMIKRGATIDEAGEYLGHANQTTTGKHYAYIEKDRNMELHKRFVAFT